MAGAGIPGIKIGMLPNIKPPNIPRNTEMILGLASSLTELQHNELIIYRQELRNLPNKEGFPWDGDLTKTPFPTKPDFI